MTAQRTAFVRKTADVPPADCPCGQSRRIVTAADNDRLSIHRVTIAGSAREHYHKTLTEYYYVLTGAGEVTLDDRRTAVGPGDVICIPPGTRHAMRGDFEILNIVTPPFDPADEYEV